MLVVGPSKERGHTRQFGAKVRLLGKTSVEDSGGFCLRSFLYVTSRVEIED